MKKNNTLLRISSSIIMFLILLSLFIFPNLLPWVGGFVFGGILWEWESIFKKAGFFTDYNFRLNAIGLIWILILIASFIYLLSMPVFLLWLLLIVVATDIGGWAFGKTFKTDKLWEKVSPNKTWGGQIFGIIMAMIISGFFGFYFKNPPFIMCAFLGVCFSLFAQYGDLTMSWVKRKYGIKDFSNLIPGHGGFFDRFDGWIYTLPMMAIFVKLIIG